MADSATLDDEINDLFQIDEAALSAGGFIDDPFPIWAEILSRGPVHKGTIAECMGMPPERMGGGLYVPGLTYYTAFSFAAVSEVFTRKDDFWSQNYVDQGTVARFGDNILFMDGLRHRRYRDVIQPFFQPAWAESWWREKIIVPLVNELVEQFGKQNSVDLNSQFFARLPLHTMTSGFGMSFEDGLEYRRHMQRATYAKNAEERDQSAATATRVLDKVVREKQKNPADDLISELCHKKLKEEDGSERHLTAEEVANFCKLIIFAGGETTWRQLGIATFALLSHPEQYQEIVRDRSLLQNAILESTRWCPDPLFPRKVKRDTVLQGVELPEGAMLHLCIGAANRDPTRWDHPEQFNIHRPLQRSLAFAAGAHSCLGQHVARQEISTALNALMDHFPNMRWDPSKPPAFLTGNLAQRGPGPLHVLLH